MYSDIAVCSTPTMSNPSELRLQLHAKDAPDQDEQSPPPNKNNNNNNNACCKNISIITTNSIDHIDHKDEPTTPTSPARRIPEIGPCPSAPRKPKSLPVNNKRKFYSSSINTILQSETDMIIGVTGSSSANRLLDFSKEVESMYPPLLQANLGRKIKKARSV